MFNPVEGRMLPTGPVPPPTLSHRWRRTSHTARCTAAVSDQALLMLSPGKLTAPEVPPSPAVVATIWVTSSE